MTEKSIREEMSNMADEQNESSNEDLFPSSRNGTCKNVQKTLTNINPLQKTFSYLTPHFSRSFHFDFSPISSIRESSLLPSSATSKDSVNTSDFSSPNKTYFLPNSDAVIFGEEFEWGTLDVTSDSDYCSSRNVAVIERIENKNVSDCSNRCLFSISCCSIWSVLSFLATIASFVACVLIIYMDFDTNNRICPSHKNLYLSVPTLIFSAIHVMLKWNLCDVLPGHISKANYDNEANMAVIFLQHLFGLIILCQASLCWPYKFFASIIVLTCFLQVIFEQLNQKKSFT